MKLEKMEFCEYNKALLAGERSRDGCKLTAAVCPAVSGAGTPGRAQAFARLHEIARRCNVHDEREALIQELMTALEELVAEFDADDIEAQKSPGCGGLVETGGIIFARAVLAKAKGEAND